MLPGVQRLHWLPGRAVVKPSHSGDETFRRAPIIPSPACMSAPALEGLHGQRTVSWKKSPTRLIRDAPDIEKVMLARGLILCGEG